VNLYVASRAVGILRVLIVLWPSRFYGADIMRYAVAGQTKLVDRTVPQQTRIRRSVRRVTRHATFGLYRSVFIGKWTLLIDVAFYASCVTASGQPRLLKFETAMRIMAIATLHGAFENLVMEGLGEIRLSFTMAAHAKLRLAHPQHSDA
jgi:hypothetical protein